MYDASSKTPNRVKPFGRLLALIGPKTLVSLKVINPLRGRLRSTLGRLPSVVNPGPTFCVVPRITKTISASLPWKESTVAAGRIGAIKAAYFGSYRML